MWRTIFLISSIISFYTCHGGNEETYNIQKESETPRQKVLVTNYDVPSAALDILRRHFDVMIAERKPRATKQDIMDNVADVDAIFWAIHQPLDEEILNAAGPKLKVIVTMNAGTDHIDLAAVKKRKIKLANTPKLLNNAVADVAILLTLAASRRLQEGRMHIEKGIWTGVGVRYLLGTDLENSTVGIVGLGGIGQAIAKRLKAFDIGRLLYSGHREKPEGKQLGAEFVPFRTLLRESDFVIVSAPLTDETRNMFNRTTFALMKNNSVFVNVARGQIVDQDALIEALKDGTIFAAGLDVMVPEPLPTDSELLKLPNCVLTPHIGSATINVREQLAELAVDNIIRGLQGKPLLTPVF